MVKSIDKVKKYIPDKGEIVWLDFDPQAGREQKGRRPALVISPKIYNEKTNLAVFCPITSKRKNYPFEVLIPDNDRINGVILSDQVKNLDWKSRNAELITNLQSDAMLEVMAKLEALLFSK